MDETKRIIDTYGNHPSLVMMAYGNEPSGNCVEYIQSWVDHFREYDPQRVFTGASTGRSWSIIENSDFIVRSPPRGLEWDKKQPESEFDYRDKTENQNRPYVTHEMGQWCVALVGVLDAFWDEKGYITEKEFRQFCNDEVPRVRLPKYTFSNQELLDVAVEVANFSGKVLDDEIGEWRLLAQDSSVVLSGKFNATDVPVWHGQKIGNIGVSLRSTEKAQKLVLEVQIGVYLNSWNIWVYPPPPERVDADGIHIAKTIDDKAKQILEVGGKVLLMAAGNIENGKDVVQYFTPVFWNTSWFMMRPPHTTGLLIDDKHPVFDQFPTDYYSDLQWWELVNKQQVMNLESFPSEFKPIIPPIGTWFLNRRLATLFEAKVGNGDLMVCSIDLDNKQTSGIVSKQFHHSLLCYLTSGDFNPEKEIDIKVISELFEEKERETWNSYVNDTP